MNNFTKYRDTLSNSDDDSDNESVSNNHHSINLKDLCNENLLYSSDDEHEVVDPLFNLVENTQKKSQMRKIAEIFEGNVNTAISSKKINTKYSINHCFSQIHKPFNKQDLKDISSYDDLNKYIQKLFQDNDVSLPGDVQRQLRTFYEKFQDKGLSCDKSSSTPIYKWRPKSQSEIQNIVPSAARNIFKTKRESDSFMKGKKNKCEICGRDEGRMAIDHWRAHSIYNIDSKKIAVLLCEKCNNIHSNRDASHIIIKYKSDINIINNWIRKEKEIRDYGFEPNSKDRKTQLSNIKVIIDYWNKKNINLTEQFKSITNNDSDDNFNKKLSKLVL